MLFRKKEYYIIDGAEEYVKESDIFNLKNSCVKLIYKSSHNEVKVEDLGVYYTIVTEPKIKTTTYRYDIKEDYLISLEEIRDDQINKILDNGKVS